MKLRRIETPYRDPLTRTQRILGWLYLAVHIFVLPGLLTLYGNNSPDGLSNITANLIYYGVGLLFCLTVMFSLLRGGFDALLDRLRLCILTVLLAMLIDYALSGGVTLVLLLLEDALVNPNTEAIFEASQVESGLRGLTVFLIPIVEEVLFRGVVFGSIRSRSRFWAYAVSAAVFALYHVWQYALADPALLIYALQYVPISVALAWAYERSGSIWTCIFFHMGINAFSFYVLETLQML